MSGLVPVGVLAGLASTLLAPSAGAPAAAPLPVLGSTLTLRSVAGTVLVRLGKGQPFVALSAPRQVPVGTVVDTRRGTVRITSATEREGIRQSGTFDQGVFQMTQSRYAGATVDLHLEEGAAPGPSRVQVCKASSSHAAAPARSRKILGLLLGDAHGHFRIRGRFSSASVRGTRWGVQDRCDGTLTRVRRGTVLVHDFRRQVTVVVTAGHTYLARGH